MKTIYRAMAAHLLVACSLVLAAHQTPAAPPASMAATPSTAANAAAVAANQFGYNITQSVVSEHPTGNIFLSPTSLYLALSMADAGSGSTTKTAMDRTLGASSIPASISLTSANAALLQTLTNLGDNQVTLTIANALWADNRVRFAPAFVRTCRDSFGAQATSLNFANAAAAAGAINAWVAQHTHGKIPNIVTPDALSDSSNAVLTNAVYFKGAWGHPFHTKDTASAPFHRPSTEGGDKQVPMMHAFLPVGYLHLKEFDSVRLPYGHGRYSFYGFLPPAASSPESLTTILTPTRFRTVERQMIADAGDNIDVRLPRFKIAFSTDMRSPLTHQGMGIAFTAAADFKPMGFPHECIASVIHKAVLEVDESGSEAAAATAVIMRTTAAFGAPHVTPVIVFDRPFLCAIVDDTTGAILFEGIVRDPN